MRALCGLWNSAEQRRVDAVVADLAAPRKGATWLFEQLRERAPTIRRIVMAHQDRSAVASHVESGLVQGFVSKPLDVHELMATLVGATAVAPGPGKSRSRVD